MVVFGEEGHSGLDHGRDVGVRGEEVDAEEREVHVSRVFSFGIVMFCTIPEKKVRKEQGG